MRASLMMQHEDVPGNSPSSIRIHRDDSRWSYDLFPLENRLAHAERKEGGNQLNKTS